jgi:protein-tyrosine phosphatase
LLSALTLAPATLAQERGDFRGDDGSHPYTHLRFPNDPGEFRFAVVGDNSGGTRPGVLPAAVDLLNLLRPDFVVNVGDFIEGYVEDEATLKAMWSETDAVLEALEMPFFFVQGNHDVNLDPSEKVWFDRVGAARGYSHFVYRDVLFLMLSTEDPPKNEVPADLGEKYERLKRGEVASKAEASAIIVELEAWAGQVSISEAQVAYFEKALADHPDARWTMVFMHTPAWEQADPGNFTKIEALLADRPYTVFAGHTHSYDYQRRHGHDYITLGTVGGAVTAGESGQGTADHLTWITMTDEGPVVSNLLLNGIFDKRGATAPLRDFLLYRPRQITQTGQSLGLKSVPNLRDLGGYRTADGATVAAGRVYRSNQLHEVVPDDMKKLAALNLRNAFDLRTYEERRIRPGELPAEVNYVWLDVLADAEEANPAVLERLMRDPEAANEQLGGGKAEAGFMDSYRQFITLPSARQEFRKLFLYLADEDQVPALFHCTTGKDRTGWAAAALLTLLGVPRETVMEDYLRSNDYILPMYQGVIDAFVEAGGDGEIPAAILGVKREYLEAAFDEMETRYGTIETYFADGLGIGEEGQQALRDLYLFDD